MPAKLPADKALEDMQRLAQEHGGELVPGQQYRGSQGKLQFRCITHDLAFEQMPQNLRTGKWGCPECSRIAQSAGNQRARGVDPATRLQEITQIVAARGGTIAPGQEYVNAKTKLAITCLAHGETFEQTPDRLLRGLWGCRTCWLAAREKERGVSGRWEVAKNHQDETL